MVAQAPRRGGALLVSRLKDSTHYAIVEERAVVPNTGILRDEVVVLASEKDTDQPLRLRRVEIQLEGKQDTLAFIANDLKLAASTIAAIYKDRWRMELFFKALKQSLRIKAFIGAGPAGATAAINLAPFRSVLMADCRSLEDFECIGSRANRRIAGARGPPFTRRHGSV